MQGFMYTCMHKLARPCTAHASAGPHTCYQEQQEQEEEEEHQEQQEKEAEWKQGKLDVDNDDTSACLSSLGALPSKTHLGRML